METLLLIGVLILLLVILALRVEVTKWRKMVDQVLNLKSGSENTLEELMANRGIQITPQSNRASLPRQDAGTQLLPH